MWVMKGDLHQSFESHEQAIELILQAIEKAGFKPGVDISLSLDSASRIFSKWYLHNAGKNFSSEDMVEYYSSLISQFPIYSIEDGLDENDHQGWALLNEKIGNKVILVGDDLFVTNKKILQEGIDKKLTNQFSLR